MLTISAIKNSSGAANYYTKEDNYYLAEVDASETSTWWGKGAEELELGGKVDINRLSNVLAGKLPNGVTIGLQRDGTIRHRAGFDLCFHAPKSVSILALVGEDKRFYAAHLEAVKETLQEIETNCATARVYKGKNVSFENTKNLTVALIKHITSRALDPHLHHHALITNVTKRQDSTWRALASSMQKDDGFFEKIYRDQIYYGLVYKHALANKITAMGYAIENVGVNGLWEIKGIPKAAIDMVAKRRKEIEKHLKDLNYNSLKAADMVSLDTREKKPKNISLNEIKKNWHEELAAVGFSAKEFIAKHEKSVGKIKTPDENNEAARETIKDALEHLAQYNLKLTYTKIVSQALEFSIGNTTHHAIIQEVDKMIKEGLLLPLDKAATVFVIKELLDVEKNIMDFIGRGKGSFTITLKNTVCDIPEEIKNCAIDVLCTKNRIGLVENSMRDNTTIVAAILELAEASGKTVRILAPSRLMANNINENIRRKPNSLWQWLISLGKPELGESVAGFKYRYQEELNLPAFLLRFKQGKDVIIVDNSEMLGCKDIQTLLELTEKAQAKLIFLHNTSAKLGIGNPIATLKQAGIARFNIGKNKEQSLGIIELKEVKDDHVRIRKLSKYYAQQPESAIVISSKNRLKLTNSIIREELKNQGRLSGIEHEIIVLNPVTMSRPESTLAHKYHKNMVIRIYKNRSAPEDWQVNGYNRNTNLLRLSQNRRKIFWNPKKEKNGYAIFRKELLQVAKGDKLIATGNMHAFGIKNGSKFIVSGLSDKYVELSGDNATAPKKLYVKLTALKNSHLRYDYASTMSRSQASWVIANIKAYTLDKPTILELAKRTKGSLVIFTDDANLAQKRLSHIPVKLTATETVLAASQVARIINNKTKEELNSDLERALGVLKDQYALGEQPARKAVEFAIEKITSHDAGFSHKDLMIEALKYVLKDEPVTKDAIEKVITEKYAAGELVTGRYLNDSTLWTTKEILELERTIIGDIKQGTDKLEPLLEPKIAKNLINTNLTADQQNAIMLLATTKDQYVIIQGYAGTGKTTIFKHVQSMLKEVSGGEILALAPTHKTVIALKNVGLKAQQTLKSFLVEQRMPHEVKLIVLDEVSMVSNRDFAQFSKIVGTSKAHVVLSGDIDQHTAIEAGKPFEMLQKSKILKTAFLREIVRQKNPNLKAAVKSTIDHDYQSALAKIEHENPQKYITRLDRGDDFFKKLNYSIVEVDNLRAGGKSIELMVAEDYLTRTPEVRDNTVMIVHAHEDRAVITKFIREGLKNQGVLATDGIMVDRLTPKRLTDSEHKFLEAYIAGDVVKFGKRYYHVRAGDKDTKSILLQEVSGKTRYFYPQKEVDKYNVELYSHTREELAIGDKIRLTKTDKKRGLYANFEYRVKEIDDKQMVLTGDNSQITLNHKKLKDAHWDYAQTVTGYGIQGGSEKYAIDFEVSYRKQLANQRSFYIGASRAIWHLAVYTDSKEKLLKNLYGNAGDKCTALEVTGELNKASDVILAGLPKQKTYTTEIFDAKEIAQFATGSAEVLVERLMGQPNKKLSSAGAWRYGNKGSLVINMKGDKRGLWHNFETGESGNLLTLIQKNLGLSFKESLQYASSTLGHVSSIKSSLQQENNEYNLTTNKSNEKANKTWNYAQKLAQESSLLAGTIVEQYLKNRGINNLDSCDIRYHPKVHVDKDEKHKYLPAMLALGRDVDNNICCVQATYLDPKSAIKADLSIKKRTYGSVSGTLVSLQKNSGETKKEGISFIAEGVETGLSIKDALGTTRSEVCVTLGKSNFVHIDSQCVSNRVVLCLDNDGPNTITDNTIHKAAERLMGFGKEVFIAMPQQLDNKNAKVDFNDIAKTSGVDAVKNTLDNSIPYKEWRDSNTPNLNNSDKRIQELAPSFIEKVMSKDMTGYSHVYDALLKKFEFDLDTAVKLVALEEKNSRASYALTYNQMQNNFSMSSKPEGQIKEISAHDANKFLAKSEREI